MSFHTKIPIQKVLINLIGPYTVGFSDADIVKNYIEMTGQTWGSQRTRKIHQLLPSTKVIQKNVFCSHTNYM
jgi:hypothetical protein